MSRRPSPTLLETLNGSSPLVAAWLMLDFGLAVGYRIPVPASVVARRFLMGFPAACRWVVVAFPLVVIVDTREWT